MSEYRNNRSRRYEGASRARKQRVEASRRKSSSKSSRADTVRAARGSGKAVGTGLRRKRSANMSSRYAALLCIAILAALASCVVYLTAQSVVSQRNKQVIALKSELNTLIEENSQTKERINDSIDLEYVRKYAVDVLGMVYPSQSQIMKYHSDDEDYVKQYQDIPQTGE